MYFYGYFKTDDIFKLWIFSKLINFFIPLRWVEAITWENFVPAKQNPSSTKEGSYLAGMKLFTCNCKM